MLLCIVSSYQPVHTA